MDFIQKCLNSDVTNEWYNEIKDGAATSENEWHGSCEDAYEELHIASHNQPHRLEHLQ